MRSLWTNLRRFWSLPTRRRRRRVALTSTGAGGQAAHGSDSKPPAVPRKFFRAVWHHFRATADVIRSRADAWAATPALLRA
jgi:hypothetical protein